MAKSFVSFDARNKSYLFLWTVRGRWQVVGIFYDFHGDNVFSDADAVSVEAYLSFTWRLVCVIKPAHSTTASKYSLVPESHGEQKKHNINIQTRLLAFGKPMLLSLVWRWESVSVTVLWMAHCFEMFVLAEKQWCLFLITHTPRSQSLITYCLLSGNWHLFPLNCHRLPDFRFGWRNQGIFGVLASCVLAKFVPDGNYIVFLLSDLLLQWVLIY